MRRPHRSSSTASSFWLRRCGGRLLGSGVGGQSSGRLPVAGDLGGKGCGPSVTRRPPLRRRLATQRLRARGTRLSRCSIRARWRQQGILRLPQWAAKQWRRSHRSFANSRTSGTDVASANSRRPRRWRRAVGCQGRPAWRCGRWRGGARGDGLGRRLGRPVNGIVALEGKGWDPACLWLSRVGNWPSEFL